MATRQFGSASHSNGWRGNDQLSAYRYTGFWQMMDTLRDKNLLEELWTLDPPWRVW